MNRVTRIGGLFEGYGGLTMGVQAVLGGVLAWYSEFEPLTEKNPQPSQGPARLLACRHPGVPNLGDITAVDWSQVPPVDVLTGGSPCQDVSSAGRRQGMRPGTRSGLWESMREAIAVLRPSLVVWENVRGVTSACAHSDLADCPRCVGDSTGPHDPVLRALGRVLGDLADLGFDAEWHGLPASDIGAPHRRFREFVVAADSRGCGFEWWPQGSGARRQPPLGQQAVDLAGDEPGSPAADPDGDGQPRIGRQQSLECHPDGCDRADIAWGAYEPAIRRWERLTRPAPAPTETSRRGGQRLAPRFVEWMQGLPAGHITDPAIGLTRNEQLKLLGNGVVPQQAGAAIGICLSRLWSEAAA